MVGISAENRAATGVAGGDEIDREGSRTPRKRPRPTDTATVREEIGAIVVVGADTPHKFRNAGTGRLKIVCIHASPEFVNEMLPDDEASG
jgi:hypothetical protein